MKHKHIMHLLQKVFSSISKFYLFIGKMYFFLYIQAHFFIFLRSICYLEVFLWVHVHIVFTLLKCSYVYCRYSVECIIVNISYE